MNAELAQARLSAAILASCRWLCWPSWGLLLLLALTSPQSRWLPACAAVALWQAWLGWRLQLDAALLRALDSAGTLEELDLALSRLFGRDLAGRPLEARQRGMARLLRGFLLATGLCWLLCLVGLLAGRV
ncbi:hypothetical protein JW897_15250 [Chromobacterium alkanivorans]|uniref:hypothetical protein n=1 Tax=Chromobacterium TaxID=535 RepID=UPI000652E7B4|nr:MULTISPECIES: hypothetical protein [Chromobacterium]KMN83519.1 hypothetical protein VK98_02415 [Chromobacterium sp. LK11]MBN3005101.1 hypothetical protein [Chromobacterium alkanivorans]